MTAPANHRILVASILVTITVLSGLMVIPMVSDDSDAYVDLGIYTGGENLSSQTELYSGVDLDFDLKNDDYIALYVVKGADIEIRLKNTSAYRSVQFLDEGIGLTYSESEQTISGTATTTVYSSGYIGYVGQLITNGASRELMLFCIEPSVTVTFDSNGGSDVPNQVIDSGSTAIAPSDPTLDGYLFAGWYSDPQLSNHYDFTTPVTQDITLYAKWVETLVFTTVPTSGGSVSAVPNMAGTILCDASRSSNYSSILWDLGDGTVSTDTYVTHYYSLPGQYTVTLTVFNDPGSDTTEFTVNVPEESVGGGAMKSFSMSQSGCWHSSQGGWSSEGSFESADGVVL